MLPPLKTASVCLILALAVSGVPQAACAQAYPARPVRIIVPFPAGGTTDIIARLVAQRMSETIGQPAVVENRGGAGGSIGADAVAKAAPDGYTILMHNITFPLASVALAQAGRAPYDIETDFAGISIAADVPLVITAPPSVPARNLREMVHIPLKGAAPLKQELLAGRLQLGGDQLSSSLAEIRRGALKALATNASQRLAVLPEVPTVRELGFPKLEADGWNGLFAPAKTPRGIIERLQRETAAAVRHPDSVKRLTDLAAEPVGSTPAEQDAVLRKQLAQFRPIIRELGVTID